MNGKSSFYRKGNLHFNKKSKVDFNKLINILYFVRVLSSVRLICPYCTYHYMARYRDEEKQEGGLFSVIVQIIHHTA